MTLQHQDIWLAIDRLAERQGLSPSGLARKAGLSSTLFNPSKRLSATRKRWPSTESLAQILAATDTSLDEFVALAQSSSRPTSPHLPLFDIHDVGTIKSLNDLPVGAGSEIRFPQIDDPHAFVLEISNQEYEPLLHPGDRLVLSPETKARRGDRVVVLRKKGDALVGSLQSLTAREIICLPLLPQAAPQRLPFQDIAWLCSILWIGLSA